MRIISVGADLCELPSDAVSLGSGASIESLAWSPDGQILSACTLTGHIHCFLGAVPKAVAACEGFVAHMATLTECTVSRFSAHAAAELAVPLPATPHCLAISRQHLAASVNNRVSVHSLAAPADAPHVREYAGGSVEALTMSDSHLAALLDGRVTAHALFADSEALVPYREQDVTAFALTDHFLVIATAKGQLQHYLVGDGTMDPLNEFRHTRGAKPAAIEKVWASRSSVHALFMDNTGAVFHFSPVNDQVLACHCACLPVCAEMLKAAAFSSAPGSVLQLVPWMVISSNPDTSSSHRSCFCK